MDTHAHIIAEAGVNHNGSVENARLLIDVAAEAKADSVKFQIINPYGLYLPGDYKYGHYEIAKVIENRFSTVLTDEQYESLADYTKSKGLQFSSSIFDSTGLKLLDSFDPPYIKIASCDLTNIRLLREVAQTGRKMILSTGMSTLPEIEKTLAELDKLDFRDIVLLHCVSVYPCPLEKTNLHFISTLQKEFGYEVGLSDHTRTNEAATVAYSMGCRWFEKHYTYDNDLPGFDHKHAQNQEEFTSYVASLRAIEISLIPKTEKLTDAERYTAERARRSLFAARTIRKGETIADADILCVRPSGIMSPNQIDLLVGSTANKDIEQYQPFSLDLIS